MNEQTLKEFKDNEGQTRAIEIESKPRGEASTQTLEQQVEAGIQDEKKAKLKIAQKQDNVETVDDSNVVLIGNKDMFDDLFCEYYQVKRVGFDALFTDERFPRKDGKTVVVSRCYHYPIKGKYLLFDILEKDEMTMQEILENKAVFNALGFLYTWVVKEEEGISLADIFEKRLNMEVAKIKVRPLRQNNVDYIETK